MDVFWFFARLFGFFVLCFLVWFAVWNKVVLWGFFLFLVMVAVFAHFLWVLLLCFLHKVIYFHVLIKYLTRGLRLKGLVRSGCR